MPNEATNFRESLAENVVDIAFGQGHFTESVMFFPIDDSIPPRLVDGIVTRKVKQRDKNQTVTIVEGMVRIQFQRSATLGVVELVQGDAVRLEETKQADCDRWTYQRTVGESPRTVIALFMKSTIAEYGNIQADQL